MKAAPQVGRRLPRNEDARLLTGEAVFVDDIALPGMLHAAFVRSPHAHARILDVDATRARGMPGVVAAYAAADLGGGGAAGPMLLRPPESLGWMLHERTQVPLARDKVRHVGEPVAVVLADSRYRAEDAAREIDVDYRPLPVVLDLEAALAPDAPRVHEDLPSNLAAEIHQCRGDYAAAARAAHLRLARRFRYDRGTAAAMETRGVVADWDRRARRLRIWDTTQAPIPMRNLLAARLGLSEQQVHLVAPFMGGGFGPKIMMCYPEEMLIPWLSMQLGRPVKWIGDRAEDFVGTTQERLQIHDAEIALDRRGRILGVHDRFLHDTGAYDPYGLTIPLNSQCTLLGPYDIPNYDSAFRMVFSNRPIVTPYRGAGRQHGVFVIERLLDLAARALGIDRVALRRRNLLRRDQFPHDHAIIYQDFAPLRYDSGHFRPLLKAAAERIGHAAKAPRRAAIGTGVVTYVEGTGIGPYEGARVQVQNNGKVVVATGVGTQGQGHFTVFAQIVADQLGVAVSDVEVVTGDSDRFHWGTGTFASRGAVVAGNAVHAAARDVRARALALAARALQVPKSRVELVEGSARDRSDPSRSISLAALARQANPLRGAVTPGTQPGLEGTAFFGPALGTTAAGAHAVEVEIDPDTFDLRIRRYVVAHDCGVAINPLLVDGQIHGGVAQGIGNAWYERLDFDAEGRLRNGSLRDYLLPSACEVPRIEVLHFATRGDNALGTKGVGEAGAIPVGAAIAQAIEDALDLPGFEILEMPLSPDRLFALVAEHRARSAAAGRRGGRG